MVSIMGHEWHCVGVDEAHKMLINRACKTSIVHPSKDYINPHLQLPSVQSKVHTEYKEGTTTGKQCTEQ